MIEIIGMESVSFNRKKSPMIIGIAGGTGSGKTTLANGVINIIGEDKVAIIRHDSYYRDQSHILFEERVKINFDHPDALETDLLVRDLRGLIAGRRAEIPCYDFATHTRKKGETFIPQVKAVIVEGILVLADKGLRDLMDFKIYIECDDDIRFIRRLKRDLQERSRGLEDVIYQYLNTVKPMHEEYVKTSKRFADIIVYDGKIESAVDMIVPMIRDRYSAE